MDRCGLYDGTASQAGEKLIPADFEAVHL